MLTKCKSFFGQPALAGYGAQIRSTDNGDHWNLVTTEGDHGIDLQRINGGFAAITESQERRFRVRTSYDSGATSQAIDAGFPVHVFNIAQVGENLFCSHRNGIFGSSDNGKTWKLLLPSVDHDIFHLSVSGNVIYAMRNLGGVKVNVVELSLRTFVVPIGR